MTPPTYAITVRCDCGREWTKRGITAPESMYWTNATSCHCGRTIQATITFCKNPLGVIPEFQSDGRAAVTEEVEPASLAAKAYMYYVQRTPLWKLLKDMWWMRRAQKINLPALTLR